MIKTDPWKRIERDKRPFNLAERIFVIAGNVAQPPKKA